MRSLLSRPALALLALTPLLGCVEEQRYLVENERIVLRADSAPAYVDDDDDPVFQVERRLPFPISRPGSNTLAALAERAQGLALPYPRLPWVEASDLDLQLDFALANLDDEAREARVVINGFNEFHEYVPGPEDLSQWERLIALEPKQRVHGQLDELLMHELAVDLATVVNGAPNSNQVVHPQSQSGRDPRVAPFIPARIPALIGVRVGIVSNAAANIVLEVSVRGQDHGDRLPSRGEPLWDAPEPAAFVPLVILEEP